MVILDNFRDIEVLTNIVLLVLNRGKMGLTFLESGYKLKGFRLVPS